MDVEQRREHWRGLLEQQAQSGQSVREWCAASGEKEWQYYAWKARLRGPTPEAAGKASAFIPLELPAQGTLSIDFGRDIHVEVSGACSLAHLREALEILRGSARCWR